MKGAEYKMRKHNTYKIKKRELRFSLDNRLPKFLFVFPSVSSLIFHFIPSIFTAVSYPPNYFVVNVPLIIAFNRPKVEQTDK